MYIWFLLLIPLLIKMLQNYNKLYNRKVCVCVCTVQLPKRKKNKIRRL